MLGSMAAVPLPGGLTTARAGGPDALRDHLRDHHGVVAPVIPWPGPASWLLRVSAHLYNQPADYARLLEALRDP